MPQEVVNLVIGVKDQDGAVTKLETLDSIVDKINNKKITLSIDTSSVQTFTKDMEKSIQIATQNINAQAKLLAEKNKEATINEKLQQALAKQATAQAKVYTEAEKTRREMEKTAQAQAKVQEAQAKAASSQAQVAAQVEKTKQAIEKTAQAQAKVAAEAQKTATVEEKRKLVEDQLVAAYEKAELKAQGLNKADSYDPTPIQKRIDDLTGVSASYKSAAESAKVFMEIEKKVGTDTGNKLSPNSLSTSGFENYIKNVEGIENATVAATKSVKAADSTFQQFSVSVKTASGDYKNFTYSVDTATGSVYKMENGMSSVNKTAGKLNQGLGDLIGKFAQWAVVSALFYAPIQAMQDAVQELKNVDDELVNIQKVMGATASEMDNLSDRAFEVGSSLGVAASDYLASVNKWAQAGYDSLSADLGELSVKTQKVGDVQEETANQFLLSVDAAYKYKGNIEELTKVLDGANEISNNYATSVEKLAGGMGIVSSLAAQAGMQVEETMAAIGTITAVTQESGNSAARALRALILNIQGSTEIAIDEETGERWTEDEIEQTAAALGDLNIATREYKDGVEQLRNPMEVIGELSEKYRAGLIDEVQLQDVVSSLGGKVRSNQLQALISNFDMYEDMLDTYKESVGSADRELDIYLNSWEAKANRLQNQWVEFADNMKTSEISKGLLDVGNALLMVANTDIGQTVIQVVALTAAVTALAVAYGNYARAKASADSVEAIGNLGGLSKAIASIKEFGASFLTAGSAIKGAVAALMGGEGLSAALATLTASTGGTILVVLGLVAAVAAAVTIFDKLNVTTQEHLDNAEKFKDEYESATSELEEMNSQLEENKKKIEELNAAGPLTLTDQAQVDLLKTQNDLLETQISLKKKEQEEALKNSFDEYYGAFEKGIDSLGSLGKFNPFEITEVLDADGIGNQIQVVVDNIKELEDEMNSLGNTEADLKKREDLEEKISSWNEVLTEITPIFEETMNAAIQLADATQDPKAEEFVKQYSWVNDTLQIFADEAEWATKKIDELADSSSEFANALNQVKADGEVTLAEVEGLLSAFPQLQEILDKSGFSAQDLAEHLTAATRSEYELGTETQNTTGALSDQESEVESLSDALNDFSNNFEVLESAQEELREAGTLSIDTIIKLIETFPDLENAMVSYQAGLINEQQLMDILAGKYQDNANNYRLLILSKMENNEEFYKNTILTNTDIVAKLHALGLTDLSNYKTVAELKQAAAEAANAKIVSSTEQAARDAANLYQQDAANFAKAAAAKASANSLVSFSQKINDSIRMTGVTVGNTIKNPNPKNIPYYMLSSSAQKEVDAYNQAIGKTTTASTSSISAELKSFMSELDSILSSAIKVPTLTIKSPSSSGSTSHSSSGGSSASSSAATSTKSWYEEQIDALNDLVTNTKNANKIIDAENEKSYQTRIDALKSTQAKISDMEAQFRNKGISETSDEMQQLKLMYIDLADEIEAVYEEMYTDLQDELGDKEFALDKFIYDRENANRTLDEIAEDNTKIVAEYKKMQTQIKQLMEYYQSQGYDETDDLIQDLTNDWWDYQEKIESVYDDLSDAFDEYITKSEQQIKSLERISGTAGEQIAIYTERIQEAQKAIEKLQQTNFNGLNNDQIFDIQDQIWSDEDAIKDIQDSLWQELEDAINKEFEKKKEEIDKEQEGLEDLQDQIDEAQEHIDDLDDILEKFDKELEDILEPIEERLEDLNDRLEAEKEALEGLVDPLNKKIEGYYEINPDGTLGVYVPGLDDEIEDLQDQLDKVNEEWDEQQKKEDEALALQKKELALQEAIKNLEQAQLDLQTAKEERTVYTLKDGVWAWRADEQAIKDAEDALEDAEQAKEDAEKELEDLKEQQAHDKIVNALEDQLEALEKEKKLIQKQIEAYEKESEARQDYIEDLIEKAEDEKEAWEKYYDQKKEQYEEEKELWEDRKDQLQDQYDEEYKAWQERQEELQKQYDEWMDEWEEIQESVQEPARSIGEILADIAKNGTPAMKEQVDKITSLLKQMGVAFDDFYDNLNKPSGGSGDNLYNGMTFEEVVQKMYENGQKWTNATSQAEKDYWHQKNLELGALIGATFDPATGAWDFSTAFGQGNNNQSWTPNQNQVSSGTSTGSGTSSGLLQGNGNQNQSTGKVEITQDMVQAGMRISNIKSQAQSASEDEKKDLFEQANTLAVANGALSTTYSSNVNNWKWYDSNGNWLFDKGGVADGKGVMLKDVAQPEVVLSPVLASDVLNPIRNKEFMQFADSLGIMFSSAHDFAADMSAAPAQISNNSTDSHNVYINGVQIGESMMQRPLSETLSLLGIHRNM
jgi:TP901 family phage tail tape measure protein